jgi:hypothetical protein
MPLTLRDLKKAEKPILSLIDQMVRIDDEHERGKIFQPKVMDEQLKYPESNMRKALDWLKRSLDSSTWNEAPNVNGDKESADVRIGLKAIQSIYDALQSGKYDDAYDGLMTLPSVQFAFRSFLEKQPEAPEAPEASKPSAASNKNYFSFVGQSSTPMTNEELERWFTEQERLMALFNEPNSSKNASNSSGKKTRKSRKGRKSYRSKRYRSRRQSNKRKIRF